MDRNERARVYASLGDEHRLEIVERLLVTDLTPTEIGRQVDLPSNLLAHHLDVLESAGVIDRRVSDGDARRRYVRVITDTLPDDLRPHAALPDRVLFACRHNSARSQLAAALFEERTGRTAPSAGSQPARAIHSKARAAGLRWVFSWLVSQRDTRQWRLRIWWSPCATSPARNRPLSPLPACTGRSRIRSPTATWARSAGFATSSPSRIDPLVGAES